jgi:hypothetical protein
VTLKLAFAVVVTSHSLFAAAPWTGWKPATCLPNGCFCEAIRPGSIAQPANTWSSFSFVLLGGAILAFSGGKQRADFRRTHAVVFGVALILIGLGSAFYHASLTFVGQLCDVQGMYLLAIFIALYAISHRGLLSDRLFVLLYILVNGAFLLVQIDLPGVRRYLFAVVVLTVIAVESGGRFFYAAIAIMAVAFGIWILDITRTVCSPMSLFQGHAIWHVLGAIAALALYMHYTRGNAIKSCI